MNIPNTNMNLGNNSGRIKSFISFIRYNASNVFAGKFIYFLGFAVALFLFIIVVNTLEESTPPNAETIFYFLITPGVLLLFYPSCFMIQSDVDSHMIETLFGIPDYRYKVWLVRYLTQIFVILALLAVLALFCKLTLADFPFFSMLYQLIFPILFLSGLGFMIASITRSGNGTAAVMVVIIMFFWIAAEPLNGSRYDLFHNPFAQVDMYEMIHWQETTFYNRIYLMVSSLIFVMIALFRLQKREKFI